MPEETPRDDLTVDEIAARLGRSHRFPWRDVPPDRLLAFVEIACQNGCGVTFGTMGYGVLGSIRVRTSDDRTWAASYHDALELSDDLWLLGSMAGFKWVLDHAEKLQPRRRR